MLYLANYEVLSIPYIGSFVADTVLTIKGQVIVEADTEYQVRVTVENWLEEYAYFEKGQDTIKIDCIPMIKYSDYKEAD